MPLLRRETTLEDPRSALVRAIADATGEAVAVVSLRGELLHSSESWRALTGQSAEPSFYAAVQPDDLPRVEAAFEAGAKSGKTFEVEFRIRRPSSKFTRTRARASPVLEAPGAVREWVVACREVWADESVRQSEERLRLATEAARVAVWEYDFVAGQMTRTHNHDGLYGLLPQPVWTYDLFVTATHPEDRPTADQAVQQACAPGGPDDYAVDFRVIWPDRSVHWLAVSGHVMSRNSEGAATLVRGALIDVTRLKVIEAELREAVRARDEFLQIASHELKTPLTPLALKIAALKQAATTGTLSSEELVRQLSALERPLRRLRDLVNDLLDVTRLSQGKVRLSREQLSLEEVLRAALSHLTESPRGDLIHVEVEKSPVGQWDRSRLEQVIENLLSNALKYGDGKPVIVRVGERAGRARLSVTDHGIGIDVEILPRVFEKFERAPSAKAFAGLGLGLYIVKQIVEAHGGTVSAASAPGAGTTFTVELPLEPG